MILEAIASVFRNSIENPSVPLSDYNQWGTGSSSESLAGPRVGREQALCLHAVWRAVDLISDSVANLPCYVYALSEDGKQKAKKHPAYQMVLHTPNAETTAFKFRKTMEAHRLLMGNAYAYVRRLGSGAPQELVILDPDCTFPVRVNGRLSYATRINGNLEAMRSEDVIHLTGLGYDGLVGYPVTHKARDSFGLGLATNQYAGEFFRNGAEPRVIISHPGNMTPDDQTRFLKQWQMMHGEGKRHSTAIMTGGGKVEKLSIDAQDAQLIEQRKFTIIEIANWFGIPPHKLGDSSRTAYNSLEQENQSYLDECLRARLTGWQQEMRAKLLTETEKRSDSHVIEFDTKDLTRADMAARAAYLANAVGGPWMTVDEGRMFEDMNARPGEEGDVLYGPQTQAPPTDPNVDPATDGNQPQSDAGVQTDMTLNGAQVESVRQVLLDLQLGVLAPAAAVELLVAVGIPRDRAQAMVSAQEALPKPDPADLNAASDGKSDKAATPNAPQDAAPPTNRVTDSHRALLARSCQKMAERIAGNSKRRAKDPKGFMEWLDEISDHSRGVMVEEFKAPLAACRAVLGIESTADELAERLIASACEQLLEVSGAATADGLEGAVSEWSKRFAGAAVNELVASIFAECEVREAA